MSATCAICMSSYEEEEDQDVVVIRCGHAFHRTCLESWKNSSRQLTCPECRTKYSARTLTKLFLNVLPKENKDVFLVNQVEHQKLQSANLERDKERLIFEKQQMEFELIRSRNEYRHLMLKVTRLKTAYDIKCEEYTLISSVNDEYLKENKTLKDQNVEVNQQLNNLKREMTNYKIQQLHASKPFVDLTHDDDSDVEIVTQEEKGSKSSEIIDLDDDLQPQENEKTVKGDQPIVSEDMGCCSKNIDATTSNDSLRDLEDFEEFILGQI